MTTTAAAQTVTLNNGVAMPLIGFGVFQISEDQTQAAVEAALEAGYRQLDTASSYGNEEAVGAAIAASGLAREDLIVTTKLWIQHAPTGSVEDDTKRAFDNSLRRIRLDYLDLYLIHQPLGDYYSEWRAMQELHREGRIRAIGVANFHADRLVDLIDHNEIPPAINQIETHPFHQRGAEQQLMRVRGVQIEYAWASKRSFAASAGPSRADDLPALRRANEMIRLLTPPSSRRSLPSGPQAALAPPSPNGSG
jgi:2,5-diketo-D-gluconate reductase A